MPTVLVVDDTQMSRVVAAQLIKTGTDLSIVEAENGRQAYDLIQKDPPDLVLTDMRMPEMTGLELVAALQRSHPTLPVIVMTAHGSEAVAAEALKQGAASYIPKRNLTRDLVDIVRRVRNAAGSQQRRSFRDTGVGLTEYEFRLDNDLDRVSSLVTYFRAELERTGTFDETGLLQFCVAVDEALNNAMCHGNLGVDSVLKEESLQAFEDKILERRRSEPWNSRRTYVRLRVMPKHVECTIRDEGEGFDPGTVPDPRDPANLDKASGRGLVLMQTFCDEVRFNPSGNEVTLVKRGASFEPDAEPDPA